MKTPRPVKADDLILAAIVLAVIFFHACPSQAQADAATGASSNLAMWIMGAAAMAGVAVVLVLLVVGAVRWVRRHRHPGAPPVPKDKPICPACRMPADDISYYLPRLAVPRRTTNLGQWQLVSPEEPEDQTIQVCASCYEVALTLARVEREKLMEARASDRRREMERLVEFGRKLPDEVKKIRNPDPPPPPPEVKP